MAAEVDRFAWTVAAGEAGQRLDHFLAARGVLGSRSQVQRLIAAAQVRVGDRALKPGTVLRAGEQVVVERPRRLASALAPEPIPLDVLYEDEWLLAINKPAGLVVHPAPGHASGTLVGALLHRWPGSAPGLDPARLGIVHRLDKDTSGVMLIARTAAALAELGRQFRRREVVKEYLALVRGVPRSAEGVIDQPIGRHPVHRQRMAVRPRGRSARTRYRVLERFGGLTLVSAAPETGRTHQIRVHLATLGCPVLADPLYGRAAAPAGPSAPRAPTSGRAERPPHAPLIGRQALHAEAIAFRHPHSGAPMRIAAPLPADFAQAVADLRQRSLTSPGPFTSVGDRRVSPGQVRRARTRRPPA